MDISHCFSLKMRQANRVLTGHYDAYLKEQGITVAQFSIMRSLWYMKSTSQKELQEVLVLQQTTLTRNLKLLIRDGYVRTTISHEDARVNLVTLTEEGKALFLEAQKEWKKAQLNLSSQLGEDLSKQLLTVADAIIELA